MRSIDVCALIIWLSLFSPAGAVTMHICTGESPILPFTTPDAHGIADQLIQQAAKEVGLTIEYHRAPLVRCQAEMRANVSDAYPAAPYTQATASFCVFPMKGTDPDVERAILTRRTLVFRRLGSRTEWSGTRFTDLSTPVLTPSGMNSLPVLLGGLGVRVDSSGKSVEANFAKMLAGRADVAIAPEHSGLAIISQPPYAGKIEALPIPFTSQPYYLIVSKRFYQANSELMDKLWNVIGRLRNAADREPQRKLARKP
ncbi:hypothetical protein GTP46_26955 [Duganella sp. FT135W]|uniref:Transporter substrate-binding domain-containing protein n=1 Tax=Duganella flavida TaxID=2692175 RepID=A0A6L8KGP0_9BURK|nr:hypothetical protein [Duganella flavida]MYM26275.1 hypothetical protein [Duganella flavida]